METGSKRVAASWSGGKDSCLACYKAMQQGYTITHLLNFVAEKTGRCCFHGIPKQLIALQAEALGIPIVMHSMPDAMGEYEKGFKEAAKSIVGISGMVFGDIYLDEHKDWVERVCREVGLSCLEPLWNEDPGAIIEEFIGLGFKAVVVSCKADLLGKEFAGRVINREMVRELKKRKICPCGENGEFHTLVVDGPIFKRGLEITASEVALVDGFWKHWFLDIKEYRLVDKK